YREQDPGPTNGVSAPGATGSVLRPRALGGHQAARGRSTEPVAPGQNGTRFPARSLRSATSPVPAEIDTSTRLANGHGGPTRCPHLTPWARPRPARPEGRSPGSAGRPLGSFRTAAASA